MNKEYIERETALKIIDNYSKTVNEDGKAIVKAVRDIVDFICPKADVQVVRHSKWEYEDSDIGWTDYSCNSCGNIITTVAEPNELYEYCPYCGAKMDKE